MVFEFQLLTHKSQKLISFVCSEDLNDDSIIDGIDLIS